MERHALIIARYAHAHAGNLSDQLPAGAEQADDEAGEDEAHALAEHHAEQVGTGGAEALN